MAHFVGKINFNAFIGAKVADMEIDGREQKCILIPLADNNIIRWNDELQYWFRAFAYREPKSRFTHFIMKFVPRKTISKLSSAQIEMFANHSIGGMIKLKKDQRDEIEEETTDFIKHNL